MKNMRKHFKFYFDMFVSMCAIMLSMQNSSKLEIKCKVHFSFARDISGVLILSVQ